MNSYKPKLTHEKRRERRRQMAEMFRSGKQPAEIAQVFDVSTALVNNAIAEAACGMRRKRGRKPGTPNPNIAIVTQEEWAAVDWTKQDRDIATDLGVCRQRVQQVRMALNKPKSPNAWARVETIPLIRWLRENRDAISGLLVSDIADLAPTHFPAYAIKRACHRLGISISSRSNPVERVTKENLKDFVAVVEGGCWEWRGRINHANDDRAILGTKYAAHHSYELFNGPIPDGRWVLHECDNPKCVNPEHLYAGTARDNALDRVMRGRDKTGGLTPDQVTRIRLLRATRGWSIGRIAEEIGVPTRMVWKVIRGKTYAWVPDALAI